MSVRSGAYEPFCDHSAAMPMVPEQRYCTRCVYPPRPLRPLEFDDDGVCTGCRVHDRRSGSTGTTAARGAASRSSRSTARGTAPTTTASSRSPAARTATSRPTSSRRSRPEAAAGHLPRQQLPAGGAAQPARTCASASAATTSSSARACQALKKLNRLCFRMMGDMNWHAHCGIFTYPVQIAVQHRIPLIIWGEHGFLDLAGMFSLNDRDRDDRQVPPGARPARLRLARHDRGDRGARPRRTCSGRATRPTRSWRTSGCAASTWATTSTGRPTPRPS